MSEIDKTAEAIRDVINVLEAEGVYEYSDGLQAMARLWLMRGEMRKGMQYVHDTLKKRDESWPPLDVALAKLSDEALGKDDSSDFPRIVGRAKSPYHSERDTELPCPLSRGGDDLS